MKTLKEIVSNGAKVKFSHYRANHLYYQTEDGITFPVPLEDTGEATFHNEEKALLMMRYIRKFLEAKNESDS